MKSRAEIAQDLSRTRFGLLFHITGHKWWVPEKSGNPDFQHKLTIKRSTNFFNY